MQVKINDSNLDNVRVEVTEFPVGKKGCKLNKIKIINIYNKEFMYAFEK